jgi:hypothetical protein
MIDISFERLGHGLDHERLLAYAFEQTSAA